MFIAHVWDRLLCVVINGAAVDCCLLLGLLCLPVGWGFSVLKF